MKNIIIVALVLCLAVFSGCDDEEMINISDGEITENELAGAGLEQTDSGDLGSDGKKSSNADNTDAKTNSNNEAGNEENSRPFVVFVCGEVENPGVYELEEGSRIIDAVMEAGGYTSEACSTYLNLADCIADSQMIYVPSVKEVDNLPEGEKNSYIVGVTATDNANKNSDGLVDINHATKEELMTLPGIGEAKAEKIIKFREENGSFSSTEGIMQISGIKDGMYNKIKDMICAR